MRYHYSCKGSTNVTHSAPPTLSGFPTICYQCSQCSCLHCIHSLRRARSVSSSSHQGILPIQKSITQFQYQMNCATESFSFTGAQNSQPPLQHHRDTQELRLTFTKKSHCLHLPSHQRNSSNHQHILRNTQTSQSSQVSQDVAKLKNKNNMTLSFRENNPILNNVSNQTLRESSNKVNNKRGLLQENVRGVIRSFLEKGKIGLESLKMPTARSLKTVSFNHNIYWEFESVVLGYAFALMDVFQQVNPHSLREWKTRFLAEKLDTDILSQACNLSRVALNEASVKNLVMELFKAFESKSVKEVFLKYNIDVVLEIFLRHLLVSWDTLGCSSQPGVGNLSSPIDEFIMAEIFSCAQFKCQVQVEEDWFEREYNVKGQKIHIASRGSRSYVRVL